MKSIESNKRITDCFLTLWEFTPDNIFIIDVIDGDSGFDFTVYDVNNPTKLALGFDPDEDIRGKRIHEIFPKENADVFLENYRRCLEKGEPYSYEESAESLESGYQHWSTLLIPIYDDDGKPILIHGVSKNISSIKSAEIRALKAHEKSEEYNKALTEMNANLDEKIKERTLELELSNNAKSRFLANISHEIRTPLTSIIGYSHCLLEDVKVDGERRSAAQSINSNGQHLLSLMNEVLDISKIEADKIEIEYSEVKVAPLFSSIESTWNAQAREKGLDFKLFYSFPIPDIVITDETRLKQIVLNLCSNAIKFTESGFIKVFVSFTDDSLEVVVEDTGIGLSLEHQENIFDAFVQADSSISRRYGGTGLGLCLSKKFANLLGGDLTVSSISGKGTKFTATIKVDVPKRATMLNSVASINEVPPRIETASRQSLTGRVLLAEDHSENNQLFCLLLRRLGLEVVAVFNGQEAVDAVANESAFNLILMDIQMPVMGGIDAIRVLKAQGCTTPVIALTANVMRHEVDSYIEEGFSDCLAKPLDKEDFEYKVSEYLSAEKLHAKPVDKAPPSANAALLKIAERFRQNLPIYASNIKEALDSGDLSRLLSEAHILKGSGGTFGFDKITQKSKDLEDAIKENNTDNIASYAAALLACLKNEES